MIAGLFFSFFRVLEILTLVPTMGMLAYFVNIFNKANQLTPSYVLYVFVSSGYEMSISATPRLTQSTEYSSSSLPLP